MIIRYCCWIDATEGVSYVLQRIIHPFNQLALVSSLHVPALGSPRYDTYAIETWTPHFLCVLKNFGDNVYNVIPSRLLYLLDLI